MATAAMTFGEWLLSKYNADDAVHALNHALIGYLSDSEKLEAICTLAMAYLNDPAAVRKEHADIEMRVNGDSTDQIKYNFQFSMCGGRKISYYGFTATCYDPEAFIEKIHACIHNLFLDFGDIEGLKGKQ